ncbi:hypothetical protein FTX61_03290 [Nitriliruptoraceae bacterium ZYF776]|nr:hypothetical protein [Profundirhabdus halotolerans]
MPDHLDELPARGAACLLGGAVGDAMGAPVEGTAPEDVVARFGPVEGFLGTDPQATDDTEFSVLTARALLAHGTALTSTDVAEVWLAAFADRRGVLPGVGFSEMAALELLRAGVAPPDSAHHAHAWSDGAAMRAAPHGVRAAGDPTLAAELATADARVSHRGEGIAGARAVAAAVAVALVGADLDEVVTTAIDAAGPATWTARAIGTAAATGRDHDEVTAALPALTDALVPPTYYWADLAPEAVALAFGVLVAARGQVRDAVLGGVNAGRDADTIAAMAGAIAAAGGGFGRGELPDAWTAAISGPGGTDVAALGTALATARRDELLAATPVERTAAGDRTPAVEIGSPPPTTTPGPRDPDRVAGAVVGLALGEATSWVPMLAGADRMPDWRRAMYDEARAGDVTHRHARPAVPFAMNEPDAAWQPLPGEITDWLAWTASRPDHDEATVDAAWRALATDADTVAGSIGVRAALVAIQQGVAPADAGRDDPHFFDDAGALRAVALGAGAPDLATATRWARTDAAVTNTEVGLEVAVAVAAAIHTAVTGGAATDLLEVARAHLPPGTWGRRLVDEVAALQVEHPAPFDLAGALPGPVLPAIYSHPGAAPETLAAALGLTLAAEGDLRLAVPAAATLPRAGASLPALTGALCGALRGTRTVPATWTRRARQVTGTAVPDVAGPLERVVVALGGAAPPGL